MSLADIKLAPIGASIIFDFDNYADPASGNSPAIYHRCGFRCVPGTTPQLKNRF